MAGQPRREPLREFFAPIELNPKISAHLRNVAYHGKSPLTGRVFEVKGWKSWPMVKRMAFLRAYVQDTSRDPAIVDKVTQILNDAGVGSRDHREQWAALLKYVQPDRESGMRYSNERDERFQSPQYTLTVKNGDCDDLAILLAALGDSHRLPWKFAISGRNKAGQVVVWNEGEKWTNAFDPSHIFLLVGWPPFKPDEWIYAEPTLQVPLGWSVLSRDRRAAGGRADLGGDGPAQLGLFAGLGLGEVETLPAKVHKTVKALPWLSIAGTIIASVGSFYVTRALLRRERRSRRRSRRQRR